MEANNEIIYTLVGVVFDELGRVLLSLRSDEETPAADHKWQFSGGVIEFGESADVCLTREFREETGYIIKPYRLINLLWSYIAENKLKGNRQQIVIIPFYCLLKGGTMQSSDQEILEVKWFNPNEIDPLKSLPGIREIVDYALRYKGVEKKKELFYRNVKPNDL